MATAMMKLSYGRPIIHSVERGGAVEDAGKDVRSLTVAVRCR
jgi:hypothetical protein